MWGEGEEEGQQRGKRGAERGTRLSPQQEGPHSPCDDVDDLGNGCMGEGDEREREVKRWVKGEVSR